MAKNETYKQRRERYLRARQNAMRRCKDPRNNRYQYYGAKGIKCLLMIRDILNIAYHSKADEMKKPQLHRLNPKKHYTVENCVFVEASEHSRLTHTGKKRSLESRRRMSESGGTLFGESHGCAKLTVAQVLKIRRVKPPIKYRALAEEFGVTRGHIYAIRDRRVWKWLK